MLFILGVRDSLFYNDAIRNKANDMELDPDPAGLMLIKLAKFAFQWSTAVSC